MEKYNLLGGVGGWQNITSDYNAMVYGGNTKRLHSGKLTVSPAQPHLVSSTFSVEGVQFES